jgi:ppGpp synthetase/RelA/SpoT-type nucleotidyltranferase
MKDLGRFRIIANFLSDVEAIRESLEAPYRAEDPSSLSSSEQQLYEQFTLAENMFKDLIRLDPKDRKTGERCRKGTFSPRPNDLSIYQVEVQVVTALQEAWDKKDHFLIYERRRAGHPVAAEHERISYALSEQLYLTDLTFDRLKADGEAPPLAAIQS